MNIAPRVDEQSEHPPLGQAADPVSVQRGRLSFTFRDLGQSRGALESGPPAQD